MVNIIKILIVLFCPAEENAESRRLTIFGSFKVRPNFLFPMLPIYIENKFSNLKSRILNAFSCFPKLKILAFFFFCATASIFNFG